MGQPCQILERRTLHSLSQCLLLFCKIFEVFLMMSFSWGNDAQTQTTFVFFSVVSGAKLANLMAQLSPACRILFV